MPTSRRLAAVALTLLGATGMLASQLPGPHSPRAAAATDCAAPHPAWLMCEDFEGGGVGWEAWFAASPFTECLGCRPDGTGANNPARIRLAQASEGEGATHTGDWALHMPAEASAGFQGASLTWRHCAGAKRQGCRLEGHEELYFRTHVKLAPDHQMVHHFLSLSGTRPDGYWDADGTAGCRPDGQRHAGTTLDFNKRHELFFYTYFPQMRCDRGGYCSGDYARQLCASCATKGMACPPEPECCWGNLFQPEAPVVLPKGRWVCLEMSMRLNTPGQADGEMAFWVDGAPALRQGGMHWRDAADLRLNKAWLQHYIAGGDATQSNAISFDDVVVSTERIGCGEVATEPSAAPTLTATSAPPEPSATRLAPTELPAAHNYLPRSERP